VGWGLRPDLNIALNHLTLIMSLRKSLFQIPVEAVFVSELSLIKLLLGLKKMARVLPH